MDQVNLAIGDHASVNVNQGKFIFLLSDFQILGILGFSMNVQILFSALHTFAPQIFLAFTLPCSMFFLFFC